MEVWEVTPEIKEHPEAEIEALTRYLADERKLRYIDGAYIVSLWLQVSTCGVPTDGKPLPKHVIRTRNKVLGWLSEIISCRPKSEYIEDSLFMTDEQIVKWRYHEGIQAVGPEHDKCYTNLSAGIDCTHHIDPKTCKCCWSDPRNPNCQRGKL